MTTPKGPQTVLEIAARVAGEDGYVAKLLVLAVRKDGSIFSLDNGLTADEARTLTVHFQNWIDDCLRREEDSS